MTADELAGAADTGNQARMGARFAETEEPPMAILHGISGHAHIETPAGEVKAMRLGLGEEVWTRDPTGARVPGRVVGLESSAVDPEYQPLQLSLADGRSVVLSVRHPLADGRAAGTIREHETLDGTEVWSLAPVEYDLPVTYDLLVEGGDGTYWADGIALGSTLLPK